MRRGSSSEEVPLRCIFSHFETSGAMEQPAPEQSAHRFFPWFLFRQFAMILLLGVLFASGYSQGSGDLRIIR